MKSALQLFRQGLDTAEIAAALGIHEADASKAMDDERNQIRASAWRLETRGSAPVLILAGAR